MRLSTVIKLIIVGCLLSASSVGQPNSKPRKPRIKAVAFDYFVLFDPMSVVPFVEKEFPGKGIEFTRAWQSKQFDYAFLRSITGRHKDFFQVTADALEFTAKSMNLSMSPETKEFLVNAYLKLKAWPDTISSLRKLRSSGIKIITIANFSGKMLRANADNAGITDLFDELLSTEVNGTFKPDPKAYELGLKRLHLKKEEIVFAAFGGWDVFGAKSFGYRTYWVNRFSLPGERLGLEPDGSSTDLEGLLKFVLNEEYANERISDSRYL
jgi:2-haloacid dehalogenase